MVKYDPDVFDLADRWSAVWDAACFDDAFDFEAFKELAAHTFVYLFQFRSRGILPREILALLFKIKQFADFAPDALSDECEVAKMVAQEFCNQMEDCWVETEDDDPEDVFVVAGPDDMDYIIDANTFDLTELIAALSEQNNQPNNIQGDEKILIPKRVLIADSSAAFYDELTQALKENDTVEIIGVAYDGDQAISMVKQLKPDILVLDLMLPKQDGIMVLKAISGMEDRPVTLATSRLITDYVASAAANLGARYLMCKPCEIEDLIERIEMCVGE